MPIFVRKSTPKSCAERITFTILYMIIVVLSFFGSLNTYFESSPYNPMYNPMLGMITFAGSLIVWYFILKFIFWIIRKIIRKLRKNNGAKISVHDEDE